MKYFNFYISKIFRIKLINFDNTTNRESSQVHIWLSVVGYTGFIFVGGEREREGGMGVVGRREASFIGFFIFRKGGRKIPEEWETFWQLLRRFFPFVAGRVRGRAFRRDAPPPPAPPPSSRRDLSPPFRSAGRSRSICR